MKKKLKKKNESSVYSGSLQKVAYERGLWLKAESAYRRLIPPFLVWFHSAFN